MRRLGTGRLWRAPVNPFLERSFDSQRTGKFFSVANNYVSVDTGKVFPTEAGQAIGLRGARSGSTTPLGAESDNRILMRARAIVA